MSTELLMQLLKIIEKESRISFEKLAAQIGVTEDDVEKEIKRLEKNGVIAGYHTMIDWEKAGVEKVTALIQVKAAPLREDGFKKIAEKICKYPEVSDVTLISGDYDFLITIEGKTLQEVAHFVHTKLAPIDGVSSTKSNFILEKYKEHGRDYSKKNSKGRMVVTP